MAPLLHKRRKTEKRFGRRGRPRDNGQLLVEIGTKSGSPDRPSLAVAGRLARQPPDGFPPSVSAIPKGAPPVGTLHLGVALAWQSTVTFAIGGTRTSSRLVLIALLPSATRQV